jgi:hypothetical protein
MTPRGSRLNGTRELSTITRLALFAKSSVRCVPSPFGAVEIVIQDSPIAQIERKEKIRFERSYGYLLSNRAGWTAGGELTSTRTDQTTEVFERGGRMGHLNFMHPRCPACPLKDTLHSAINSSLELQGCSRAQTRFFRRRGRDQDLWEIP